MPIKLIGRTTDFSGKTLWEIVANLKDFGVGRIVTRNIMHNRYPEACYMRIMKVQALPNYKKGYADRLVAVLVERVFRGKKFPLLVQIDQASYKPDYRLVPKDEEHLYLEKTESLPEFTVPKTMELPPLFREIVMRERKAKGEPVTEDPEMEIVYSLLASSVKRYRVAEDGEIPDRKFTIGLGTPASPSLYEGIKTDT